jgi:ABC-2 type transport system ATP-binding protein
MNSVLSISGINQIYSSGFKALKDISLEIYSGEIFALLGPNGAGKTTLINIICGIVNASSGEIKVLGVDNVKRISNCAI